MARCVGRLTNSCTDKHPEWQGGNSFAEDEARKAATDILATLSPAEPSPESREGWQPIETLTKGDGYVLGWSGDPMIAVNASISWVGCTTFAPAPC
jgi:hypothetical protein